MQKPLARKFGGEDQQLPNLGIIFLHENGQVDAKYPPIMHKGQQPTILRPEERRYTRSMHVFPSIFLFFFTFKNVGGMGKFVYLFVGGGRPHMSGLEQVAE
jgi:hypothetical protein